jgi:hypothetical protein
MSISFLVYEAIPNLVSFKKDGKLHACPWEKFAEKYNPPFGVEGILAINYEPDRDLYCVSFLKEPAIHGEKCLEINWIKANWEHIRETFHELEIAFVSITEKKINSLYDTDWVVLRHQEQVLAGTQTSITSQQFEELLAYRQALRDIPSSLEQSEDTINWPVSPV